MRKTRRLIGLENIGNTCYLNAILQCVASVPVVSNFPYEVSKVDSKNNVMRARFATCLAKIITFLQEGNRDYYAPLELKNALDSYKPFFKGNAMHDAHEFLDVVLDIMPFPIVVKIKFILNQLLILRLLICLTLSISTLIHVDIYTITN